MRGVGSTSHGGLRAFTPVRVGALSFFGRLDATIDYDDENIKKSIDRSIQKRNANQFQNSHSLFTSFHKHSIANKAKTIGYLRAEDPFQKLQAT